MTDPGFPAPPNQPVFLQRPAINTPSIQQNPTQMITAPQFDRNQNPTMTPQGAPVNFIPPQVLQNAMTVPQDRIRDEVNVVRNMYQRKKYY